MIRAYERVFHFFHFPLHRLNVCERGKKGPQSLSHLHFSGLHSQKKFKKIQDVVCTEDFLLCIESSYEGFALLFTAKPYLKLHFPCNRNFTRTKKLWLCLKRAFIPNTHKSTDLQFSRTGTKWLHVKMCNQNYIARCLTTAGKKTQQPLDDENESQNLVKEPHAGPTWSHLLNYPKIWHLFKSAVCRLKHQSKHFKGQHTVLSLFLLKACTCWPAPCKVCQACSI